MMPTMLGLAFAVGCAAAPGWRTRWDAYCCAGGTVHDPQGCRTTEHGGLEACVEAGGWAMECRVTQVGECEGGGSDCFCCREFGEQDCTMRMRSARLVRPTPAEVPPEPEAMHRRPGRIWSPF